MSPELLARLEEPDCFPGVPSPVEIRQTHLSVVCLAGEFVYKLKKPVRLPFVDFSTLQLRKHFCDEEVRLNRRLCPDVYLDVVPLFRTTNGTWSFRESEGEVVDYAVRMKRLPEKLLMDRLLEEDVVTEEQVREIARIVARFHRQSQPTPDVLKAGSSATQRDAILENFRVSPETFDQQLHQAVEARARADLDQLTPILDERAKRGLIVDGHGDLHARNICLTDPPTIFDCIEFKPEFRCGDVATENAFMIMDLIYRGHPELARAYLETYIEESGDEEQRRLLPMLVSYRAMVRAKVAALTAGDADVAAEERRHASDSATRHLQLAASSALDADRVLIIACGLPGTGKSYLCQAIAERSGWPIVSSDPIRKELAGFPPSTRLPSKFYRPAFSKKTYDEVIRRTIERLHSGCAIADANFPSAELRAQAAAAGHKVGARPVIVWVTAPDSVVHARLRKRAADDTATSDADIEVYEKLKTAFDSPANDEAVDLIQLDGSRSLDENLNQLFAELLPRSSSIFVRDFERA